MLSDLAMDPWFSQFSQGSAPVNSGVQGPNQQIQGTQIGQGAAVDPMQPFDPSANTGVNGGYPVIGYKQWAQQGVPDSQMNPPSSTGATAPQTGGGQVSMQQFNDAWLSSPYPGTVDGLKQFMAAHPEYAAAGITLGGSKGDKVYGPGGSYWGDAVIAAGLGGQGKSGLSGDGGGGASADGFTGSMGGYVAPFTDSFKAPTAEQALNEPGVQFGLEEANRMMMNGAAAKGTLLNGRRLQAIGASNVGNAMQAYGDVWGRAFTANRAGRDDFYGNQDRPFNKYLQLAQTGKPS